MSEANGRDEQTVGEEPTPSYNNTPGALFVVERVSLDQVARAAMDTIEEAMSEPSAERARLLVDSARAYSDLANALAVARGDDA